MLAGTFAVAVVLHLLQQLAEKLSVIVVAQ